MGIYLSRAPSLHQEFTSARHLKRRKFQVKTKQTVQRQPSQPSLTSAYSSHSLHRSQQHMLSKREKPSKTLTAIKKLEVHYRDEGRHTKIHEKQNNAHSQLLVQQGDRHHLHFSGSCLYQMSGETTNPEDMLVLHTLKL